MVAVKETNELHGQALAFVTDVDEPTHLLNQARNILKKRLSFFVFQGFFEPLKANSLEDGSLILEAPTSFHRNWVLDHYMPELTAAINEASKDNIKVIILDSSDPKKKDLPPKKKIEAKKHAKIESALKLNNLEPKEPLQNLDFPELLKSTNLNSKYSFETFVPGPSNQMSYSAALAVSNQPGTQYSPLFIFGGVGLGKTHLLHAIGLKAKQRDATLKVLYLSSEQWVNSYIQAIREKQFEPFRNRYRYSCDILLIDDIQFLAGKDASQDEFFHTFNCLHEAKKQIVVTSDKYPHEIDGLEERLQTRLSWGLIADIRPPEMETRLAILHKKTQNLNAKLSPEILHYLAHSVTSSVRELEGALVRLAACSSFADSPLTLGKAKEFLSPMLKKKTLVLSWQKICEQVSQNYGLRTSDLLGKSRQKQIVFARQLAMMHCRTLLSMSLPEIGRAFGGRDHSTVISALKKIEELKQKDVSLRANIDRMEEKLLVLAKS